MKRPFKLSLLSPANLSPSDLFIISFASLILLGTLLLWAPFSSTHGLALVDALFMATSSVCVTGLTTITIGGDLSAAGQVITLFLFQIGGLGIITFSAFLFSLMGRGLSFREQEIVQTTFLHTPQRDFLEVLKFIFLSTFIIEGIGAFFLFIRFLYDFPVDKALYYAVYNAASAFNNCGLSLFPDSLVRYQDDPIVNLTVMILIVLGGIGFIVIHEIVMKIRGMKEKLSLHTRIVLLVTGILIVGGALLIYSFEKDFLMKDLPLPTKVFISFFHSVVARTAGFNTVDIGQLTNPTILILMVLMFIGAAPGSTAGGIKVTSAALLFLIVWNRWKGSEDVNVFNRTIPKEVLSRTIAIAAASGFAIFLVTSLLLIVGENQTSPLLSRRFFVDYLFETVSAFGTVGLSMGITPALTGVQKVVIALMMFAGRVGPLTLAYVFVLSSVRRTVTYAEETIMVG